MFSYRMVGVGLLLLFLVLLWLTGILKRFTFSSGVAKLSDCVNKIYDYIVIACIQSILRMIAKYILKICITMCINLSLQWIFPNRCVMVPQWMIDSVRNWVLSLILQCLRPVFRDVAQRLKSVSYFFGLEFQMNMLRWLQSSVWFVMIFILKCRQVVVSPFTFLSLIKPARTFFAFLITFLLKRTRIVWVITMKSSLESLRSLLVFAITLLLKGARTLCMFTIRLLQGYTQTGLVLAINILLEHKNIMLKFGNTLFQKLTHTVLEFCMKFSIERMQTIGCLSLALLAILWFAKTMMLEFTRTLSVCRAIKILRFVITFFLHCMQSLVRCLIVKKAKSLQIIALFLKKCLMTCLCALLECTVISLLKCLQLLLRCVITFVLKFLQTSMKLLMSFILKHKQASIAFVLKVLVKCSQLITWLVIVILEHRQTVSEFVTTVVQRCLKASVKVVRILKFVLQFCQLSTLCALANCCSRQMVNVSEWLCKLFHKFRRKPP